LVAHLQVRLPPLQGSGVAALYAVVSFVTDSLYREHQLRVQSPLQVLDISGVEICRQIEENQDSANAIVPAGVGFPYVEKRVRARSGPSYPVVPEGPYVSPYPVKDSCGT
jgi:hypothetical protein